MLDGVSEQDGGQADLEDPQDRDRKERFGRDVRSGQEERNGQAGRGREAVGEKHGFERGAGLLHPHEDEREAESEGAQDRQDIAGEASAAELVHEHQSHASGDEQESDPVLGPGPLFQYPGPDDRREDGRDVLQDDRVGRGGKLVGRDEKDHRGRVGHSGSHLRKGPVEMRPLEPGEDHEGCDQAADAANRQGVPIDDLDEQPGDAPEKSRGGHRRDAQGEGTVVHGSDPVKRIILRKSPRRVNPFDSLG